MARDFNAATDKIAYTYALSAVNAFTMLAWVRADSLSAFGAIFNTRSVSLQGLLVSGGAGNGLTYSWEASADEYNAVTGLTIASGGGAAWQIAAVTISPTAAVVYLGDASSVSKWTNTKTHNAKSPSAWNLGLDPDVPASWDGRIAEPAFYLATLTDDEINSVAKGFSPRFVRPGSLVWHAPLIRDLRDIRGGVTLTATGTTVVDHPRIIYPRGARAGKFAAPAAAGGQPTMRRFGLTRYGRPVEIGHEQVRVF